MACNSIIDSDFIFNCDDAPVAGIEADVVIAPLSDVDKSAVTFDGSNRVLMTNFQLKSGKTGFAFKGVKLTSASFFEKVAKERSNDQWRHGFSGVILNMTAANKLQLDNLNSDEKHVVIVEKKWKGTDSVEAFEILGYEKGLKLTSATGNSNENDGTASIELTSEEGYEENKVPCTLLMTDYSATKTAHTNKYAQA